MKKLKIISALVITVCISSSFFLGSSSAFATDLNKENTKTIEQKDADKNKENREAINEGIANLNYNKNEVLASNGDKIESFTPREGKNKGDKFVVVERKKKSLTTSPVDISIVDSVNDRTYPGALQLADQSFVDNRPTLLVCKRKPINISIDLPGLQNENTIKVKNPNYGNVSAAVDTLVSKWNDKYSSTHTLPARTQYSESMVYSKSQISSALNVNSKVLENSLGVDFNAVANDEKKVMIVAYKQIFYTVSANLPNNPADVFGNGVSFKDLTRKGVSNEAPPLIVSNVAYGRTVYVKLETTFKSKDVQAAFKALVKNNSVEANSKYKDIYEDSTFTAVVLGGDAQEHNKVVSKDFDEIKSVIKDNATFSAKNPAYPISYTSVFLKDNSIAAVHNKTDYIETTSTEYSRGKITLDHSGAYVAQFRVSWDEVSYDKNGKEVLTHKNWSDNYKDKTAHYSTIIPLKANAKNIKVMARECTGLAWEWWRTVVDEDNLPLTNDINVSIWGTTLYPRVSVTY